MSGGRGWLQGCPEEVGARGVLLLTSPTKAGALLPPACVSLHLSLLCSKVSSGERREEDKRQLKQVWELAGIILFFVLSAVMRQS